MKLDLIIGIGQILAVALIPVVVWILGVKYQNRKTKKDAQLSLFLTLMANRKANPIAKEWVDGLNTIDVVFQDNDSVRSAWKDYYESLHTNSINYQSSNIYLLSLLSEMAKSLGYEKLRQPELDRFYTPQYFGSQMTRQELLYQENLRVLMNSESLEKSVPEDQIDVRYKEVMGSNKQA